MDKLSISNFFTHYILNSGSPKLSKGSQITALISSILIGVLTLGIAHIICALRSVKQLDPQDPQSYKTHLLGTKVLVYGSAGSRQVGTIEPRSEIFEGNNLLIYSTKGDGTCGLHALVGEQINGVYQHPNGRQLRADFCEYIRSKSTSPEGLPPAISALLDNYFLEFERAPSSFKREVRDIRTPVYALYVKASKADQEELKKRFREGVLPQYLKMLADPGEYLTQPEVAVAAEWRNLTVRLFQPGWGRDRQELQTAFLNRKEGQPVVDIYYNGINHYERALLVE